MSCMHAKYTNMVTQQGDVWRSCLECGAQLMKFEGQFIEVKVEHDSEKGGSNWIFRRKEDGNLIVRDETGKVTQVVHHQNGLDYRGKKIR